MEFPRLLLPFSWARGLLCEAWPCLVWSRGTQLSVAATAVTGSTVASLKRGWDLLVTQKGDHTHSLFREMQACLTRCVRVPATEAAREPSWEARAGGDGAAWGNA